VEAILFVILNAAIIFCGFDVENNFSYIPYTHVHTPTLADIAVSAVIPWKTLNLLRKKMFMPEGIM
jgi:hypothetical protein